MTQYISNKLKIISFFLILFVLYIHSQFHSDELLGMSGTRFIQEFISLRIIRFAVPFFFIISGYLFFYKTEFNVWTLQGKIKSRIKTVLIPYFVFCFLFFIFTYTIQVMPYTKRFMNSEIDFSHYNIFSFLLTIFWSVNNGSPLAFHLWFLRDLFVIIAFSILLWFLLFKMKNVGLIAFFILSYITVNFIPITIFSSFFWFYLGGYIYVSKFKIENLNKITGYFLLIIYITISIFEQVFPNAIFFYLYPLVILTAIIGIWIVYDEFVKKQIIEGIFLKLCGITFFLYLIHEPILNVIRKLILLAVGKNTFGYNLSFFVSPIFMIIVAYFISISLKNISIKLYSLLVGGRI